MYICPIGNLLVFCKKLTSTKVPGRRASENFHCLRRWERNTVLKLSLLRETVATREEWCKWEGLINRSLQGMELTAGALPPS